MYRSCAALGVAFALALGATASQAAELIVNGSFETGDLTGWTVTNANDFSVQSGPQGAVTGAEDGRYFLADGTFGQEASYSQTFADIAGATYTFSMWVASNGGAPSDLSFTYDSVLRAENTTAPQTNWFYYSVPLLGTGSDTITIGSRNDPAFNFFDNVSVTGPDGVDGVPEPASWALMIGGFGLAGAALRRRRAQAATASSFGM